MNPFNLEETNLICIYEAPTKEGLVNNLLALQSDLKEEDQDLKKLLSATLKKLSRLTDDDFQSLTLIPDYSETIPWD